ncbi:ABC transporter permease [Salinibaculum rarum]|uniref:ABC transporter permease n=1 Tax=Salinibaculum rarum TaxID=3058903 RepID=UPI00265E3B56|nr:ABC transporter permease [Salinibaculum sp. KK48]
MDARETLRLATRSLRGHKLRSTLTVLGIVIGIAAVVTFVTFGASLKADVVGQIDDSAANNIYLLSSSESGGGPPTGIRPVFTETDIETVRELEGVDSVVPQGQVGISSLAYGNRTVAQGTVTATTPAAFDGATFRDGRGFTAGQNEIVINEQATRLFGGNLSVGDRLTVSFRTAGTRTLTVVGIVNRTGAQLPFESFVSQPRFYVPTEPFYDTVVETPRGTDERAYPQVTVVADPAAVTTAQGNIEAYFPDSDATQLQPPEYELTAQTSGDIADGLEDLVDRLTRFVTGLALISLLVGAIGIANIMLVSVTERTREIGIMKAVGARNRDVLVLFLAESSLLGIVGALIAVPVGLAGAWAATGYADIALTLPFEWFAVAVGVGIFVGVVAGLYPAWRAARVDPIDALRRE